MKKTHIIKLDLTGCTHIIDMHDRIAKAFDFPDYYGKNWDAFWDLIGGPWDYIDVQIQGIYSLPDYLKESGEMMISLLERSKEHQEELLRTHPQFDYHFEYSVIS